MSDTSIIAESQDVAKRHAARLSVFSNALLTLLKLFVFGFTGSVSVLAETVNSAGDLLGSAVAYFTVRVADIPPDESHAFGHGKFENLSGFLIAIIIVSGAAYAFSEAIQHLLLRTHLVQTMPAIIVMMLSVISNIVVSRRLLVVGKQTDSPALTADGRHLQADVITSGAVAISLIVARVTRLYWIDPVTALLITTVVFWMGVQIARDAIMMLSDISLPPGEEKVLRDMLDSDPRVLGYHKLRTRKAGSHRHLDVHVQIDDQNSFVDAHDFSEELEDRLRNALPNLHPIVHIEPYEAEIKHQQEKHA